MERARHSHDRQTNTDDSVLLLTYSRRAQCVDRIQLSLPRGSVYHLFAHVQITRSGYVVAVTNLQGNAPTTTRLVTHLQSPKKTQ